MLFMNYKSSIIELYENALTKSQEHIYIATVSLLDNRRTEHYIMFTLKQLFQYASFEKKAHVLP